MHPPPPPPPGRRAAGRPYSRVEKAGCDLRRARSQGPAPLGEKRTPGCAHDNPPPRTGRAQSPLFSSSVPPLRGSPSPPPPPLGCAGAEVPWGSAHGRLGPGVWYSVRPDGWPSRFVQQNLQRPVSRVRRSAAPPPKSWRVLEGHASPRASNDPKYDDPVPPPPSRGGWSTRTSVR